jgi:hypothetical protein
VDRVISKGAFFIPLPPEVAFGLFTAEGERDWVPGWEPVILGDLPQASGLVFLTQTEGRETIWTVIRSDTHSLSHQYCRVTPGQHAGIVDVAIRGEVEGSRIEVRYEMTALPDSPPGCLDPYRGGKFTEMLAGWAAMICSAGEERNGSRVDEPSAAAMRKAGPAAYRDEHAGT